jgi:hypothetical protein
MVFTACNKPTREARKMTKELNDTRWEFYYAEDAYGNDITSQVISDSIICQCFELHKDDRDPSTKNGFASKCSNTYYSSYTGNWGVIDWKKLEKEYGSLSSFINRWADLAFAIGARTNENLESLLYLKDQHFDYMDDNILIHRIYNRDSTNWPTDELLEYRYYKKVE